MCCAFLALVLLGPRIFGAFWWLFQPGRWEAAFNGWTGGNLWWIWPVLGIIFVPWTTIMFVHRGAGGCERLVTGSGSASPCLATLPRTAVASAASASPTTRATE